MTADEAERAEVRPTVVYVSWGGTGRAATLRRALDQADDTGSGLLYLAILDDSTFGDIDDSTLALAKDELAWLLDAQLELAKSQTGLAGVAVEVRVRAGDVADAIIEAVASVDRASVLIGAPIPEEASDAVTELLGLLNSQLDVPLQLIEP